MPNHGDDTVYTVTYPSSEQRARWENQAEKYDISLSQFIQDMTEAGQKKFEVNVDPDQTNRELRQQRNDLKAELNHARDRIDRLETQLHDSERQQIVRFIETNPGVSFGEIIQELIDTVPERINRHLDSLDGEQIRHEGEEYYPVVDQ